MAKLVRIDDPSDPRLSDYVSLRDVELRLSVEATEGLFLAEGEKVVRRAAEAGFEARSFLMAERWLAPLDDVLARSSAPCFVATAELIEQVTGFHVHRGALASMRRRPLPSVADVLAGAERVVVLEDLVDHTNVGAIFRSAAALGVDAILLSPRCADPLYRRSVKVSMGSVFTMPYARITEWYDALDAVRGTGFRVLALTLTEDAVDIDQVAISGRVALVLGSEGPGLSRRWELEADQRVRIPMSRGVDSLNVAAAAAVACWVLTRR